jgi:hypothetical protein
MKRSYPFGHSDRNLTLYLGASYLGSLLLANGPQLILSLCYFSYNTFFTRLAVEMEWNSFSLKYQPLRVSYPMGEQISRYRLQLPYRYSVPLLVLSILVGTGCRKAILTAKDCHFFFGTDVNANADSYVTSYIGSSQTQYTSSLPKEVSSDPHPADPTTPWVGCQPL